MVSTVASASLIFLLITASLKPRAFVCILMSILMVAASLLMSIFDLHAIVEFVGLVLIVTFTLVFMCWSLLWCYHKVKGHRNRGNKGEDEDEEEEDERILVYTSLGLIAIFALVLRWCVKKLKKPRRAV